MKILRVCILLSNTNQTLISVSQNPLSYNREGFFVISFFYLAHVCRSVKEIVSIKICVITKNIYN